MSFYNFSKFVLISVKNNLPSQEQLNANCFVIKGDTTEFKLQIAQFLLLSFLCSTSPSAVLQVGTKPETGVKRVDYTQVTN